jgi:acyl dehydratase
VAYRDRISYQVIARNPAGASENRIHADEEARRHGFRGGLVPGVTVYAYASHALLEALGPEWVAAGRTRVRFVAPCYDGDELVVGVRGDDFSVMAGEMTCVVGSASTSTSGRPGLGIPALPRAPAPEPEDRPPASADVLAVGRVLGSVQLPTDWATAADYLEALGEAAPLYATEGIVHPGLLLQGANRILTANVVLPAWLHVESAIEHYRAVRVGETLDVRGRISGAWQRKGHRFVVLDVAWLVDEEAVAAAQHTAIWQLAGR